MTETPKHLNLDQYVGQENVTPRFTKPEGVFAVPPGPPELPPRYSFGFPLLHLQPRRAFTLFSVSRAPLPGPSMAVRAAAGERRHPGFCFPPSCPAPEDAVSTWRGCSRASRVLYAVHTALGTGRYAVPSENNASC